MVLRSCLREPGKESEKKNCAVKFNEVIMLICDDGEIFEIALPEDKVHKQLETYDPISPSLFSVNEEAAVDALLGCLSLPNEGESKDISTTTKSDPRNDVKLHDVTPSAFTLLSDWKKGRPPTIITQAMGELQKEIREYDRNKNKQLNSTDNKISPEESVPPKNITSPRRPGPKSKGKGKRMTKDPSCTTIKRGTKRPVFDESILLDTDDDMDIVIYTQDDDEDNMKLSDLDALKFIKQEEEKIKKRKETLENEKIQSNIVLDKVDNKTVGNDSEVDYRKKQMELEKENQLKEEQRRIEEERKLKEEAERMAREEAKRMEEERKEREEAYRIAREEAERKKQEEEVKRRKQEAKKRAEEERKAKEAERMRIEAERKAREEAEKIIQMERKAREEAERIAAEERRARQEVERKAREESERRAELDRRKAEEVERNARIQQQAREEAERRAENERKAREEAERKANNERVARKEAQRIAESERQARMETLRQRSESKTKIGNNEILQSKQETPEVIRKAEERAIEKLNSINQQNNIQSTEITKPPLAWKPSKRGKPVPDNSLRPPSPVAGSGRGRGNTVRGRGIPRGRGGPKPPRPVSFIPEKPARPSAPQHIQPVKPPVPKTIDKPINFPFANIKKPLPKAPSSPSGMDANVFSKVASKPLPKPQ